MDDDQMIEYYTDLIHHLGGKVTCYYLDGYAIYANGKVSGFMDTGKVNDVYAFEMVEKVHPKRHAGWPLDSISIDKVTGKYFVEEKTEAKLSEKEKLLVEKFEKNRHQFIIDALKLKG